MKERAFRQEEVFSAAFMSTPDIIAISSIASGVYMEVNDAFVEAFGLPREEIVGKSSFDLDIWVDDFSRAGLIDTIGEFGRVKDLEIPFRVKGGEVRRFNLSGGIVDIGGEPSLVTVSRDITERKLMEERLWKSRLLLERAEEMAKLGSWEFDFATGSATASQGAHRIYGLEGGVFGIAEAESIPLPEYRPLLNRARDELIRDGRPYDIEFKIERRSDGRILDIHSRAVWDANNRKLFGIILDITDQKRIEAELRDLNLGLERRVAERTAELERAQGELVNSEKMAALGQLMAGIAHELNSPLGAIVSSSESASRLLGSVLAGLGAFIQEAGPGRARECIALLEAACDPSKRRSFLTSLEEREAASAAALRLGQLGLGGPDAEETAVVAARTGIEELPELLAPFLRDDSARAAMRATEGLASLAHSLSTIGTSVERASRIVFALRAYAQVGGKEESREQGLVDGIEQALALFASYFRHGVKLRRSFEYLGTVRCRPGELVQVWVNLFQNAIQAMGGAGELEVETSLSGDDAVVRIIDSGTGIPEGIRDRVFEPFFTTKRSGDGTGLGLDIARRIAESHDGGISFESRPGRTCFEVRLPIPSAGRARA